MIRRLSGRNFVQNAYVWSNGSPEVQYWSKKNSVLYRTICVMRHTLTVLSPYFLLPVPNTAQMEL